MNQVFERYSDQHYFYSKVIAYFYEIDLPENCKHIHQLFLKEYYRYVDSYQAPIRDYVSLEMNVKYLGIGLVAIEKNPVLIIWKKLGWIPKYKRYPDDEDAEIWEMFNEISAKLKN